MHVRGIYKGLSPEPRSYLQEHMIVYICAGSQLPASHPEACPPWATCSYHSQAMDMKRDEGSLGAKG